MSARWLWGGPACGSGPPGSMPAGHGAPRSQVQKGCPVLEKVRSSQPAQRPARDLERPQPARGTCSPPAGPRASARLCQARAVGKGDRRASGAPVVGSHQHLVKCAATTLTPRGATAGRMVLVGHGRLSRRRQGRPRSAPQLMFSSPSDEVPESVSRLPALQPEVQMNANSRTGKYDYLNMKILSASQRNNMYRCKEWNNILLIKKVQMPSIPTKTPSCGQWCQSRNSWVIAQWGPNVGLEPLQSGLGVH